MAVSCSTSEIFLVKYPKNVDLSIFNGLSLDLSHPNTTLKANDGKVYGVRTIEQSEESLFSTLIFDEEKKGDAIFSVKKPQKTIEIFVEVSINAAKEMENQKENLQKRAKRPREQFSDLKYRPSKAFKKD